MKSMSIYQAKCILYRSLKYLNGYSYLNNRFVLKVLPTTEDVETILFSSVVNMISL